MTSQTDGPFGKVPEINVGASDAVLLTISIIGFAMLIVTIYSIIILRLKSAEEINEEEKDLSYDERLANADVSTLNRAQRRARARHLMKQQRRIDGNVGDGAGDVPPAGGGGVDDDGVVDRGAVDGGGLAQLAIADVAGPNVNNSGNIRQLSRKERQKAAKAAEREERRLFEEDRRRQQQEAQAVAQREKKEREKRQAERAEIERLARQVQRETEEQTAYEEWKMFLASPDGSKKISVLEWIQELETSSSTSRIVYVQDLSNRFHVPSETVIGRIQQLIQAGRIAGILDCKDQSFLYITWEEMETIASYVRNQDEISLDQLAKKSKELLKITHH